MHETCPRIRRWPTDSERAWRWNLNSFFHNIITLKSRIEDDIENAFRLVLANKQFPQEKKKVHWTIDDETIHTPVKLELDKKNTLIYLMMHSRGIEYISNINNNPRDNNILFLYVLIRSYPHQQRGELHINWKKNYKTSYCIDITPENGPSDNIFFTNSTIIHSYQWTVNKPKAWLVLWIPEVKW